MGSRFGGRVGGGSGGSSNLKGKQPGSGLRKLNWDIRTLEPLRKDFYVEHPAVRTRYKYESISLASDMSVPTMKWE